MNGTADTDYQTAVRLAARSGALPADVTRTLNDMLYDMERHRLVRIPPDKADLPSQIRNVAARCRALAYNSLPFGETTPTFRLLFLWTGVADHVADMLESAADRGN